MGLGEVSWDHYAKDLEANLKRLHERVQTGAYRALPSRRVFIPKPDGKERPLGIAVLEDKIVQAALVFVLTPVDSVHGSGVICRSLDLILHRPLSVELKEDGVSLDRECNYPF